MDKKLKTKWVKALRSGKYKQGKGVLRTVDNKFCCLGVLVDVMNKKAWSKDTGISSVLIKGKEANVECYQAKMQTTSLDRATMARIGLVAQQQGHLISMNDDGKRFTTIAAYIEADL